MSYIELLKSPQWQKRRLEMLERAGWKCEECSASEKQLHVHHLLYEKGRKPWEYGDKLLRVLCEDCHSEWHGRKEVLDTAFACLSVERNMVVLGFMCGLLDIEKADSGGVPAGLENWNIRKSEDFATGYYAAMHAWEDGA